MTTYEKRRKVFTATVASESTPIEFALEFTKTDGSTRTEEFKVIGSAWAGADFAVAALIRWDEKGNRRVDMAQILRFFEQVLYDAENRNRFLALVNDPEWMVPTDMIIEVYNWVVEEMAGRPTEPSSNSSNGRRSTTDISTEAPPHEA